MTSPATTQPSPELSILIVGYQAREMTLECLAGVFEHTRDVSFEVVLIDNGDDGTEQAVAQHYPQVRIVPSQGNIGFGRGNNEAARHALGQYLLLLNPDTLVKDNAIGELFKCAREHPECGAWGGMTFLPDGRRDPSSAQIGPSLLTSLFNVLGLGRYRRGGLVDHATKPEHVAVLTGAFMMVRTDVWRKLEGFDPSFFMYNEEVDLCLRIRRSMGLPIMMTPASRITHLVGAGNAMNPRRLSAMMKSRMHLDRKHHGPLHNFVKGALTWLHAATRYFGAAIVSPIVGKDRANKLRQGFAPIIFQPGSWWRGFTGEESFSAAKTRAAASPVAEGPSCSAS